MSNVYCPSPQLSILGCRQKYEYNRFCTHYNDVGVKCTCEFCDISLSLMINYNYTDCSHGDVRIIDGTSPLIGRVEVCINGGWGTVCSNYWTNDDATVVCRQLGYSTKGI